MKCDACGTELTLAGHGRRAPLELAGRHDIERCRDVLAACLIERDAEVTQWVKMQKQSQDDAHEFRTERDAALAEVARLREELSPMLAHAQKARWGEDGAASIAFELEWGRRGWSIAQALASTTHSAPVAARSASDNAGRITNYKPCPSCGTRIYQFKTYLGDWYDYIDSPNREIHTLDRCSGERVRTKPGISPSAPVAGRSASDDAQRESFARGNVAIDREEGARRTKPGVSEEGPGAFPQSGTSEERLVWVRAHKYRYEEGWIDGEKNAAAYFRWTAAKEAAEKELLAAQVPGAPESRAAVVAEIVAWLRDASPVNWEYIADAIEKKWGGR